MKNKILIQQINKKIIKPTPFGSIGVVWHISNKTPLILHVLFSRPGLSAEDRISELFPDSRKSSCMEIDAVGNSIKDFLEGDNVKFSLNLIDLSRCTKFQQSVLRAQHAIPRGRVSTYGLIAAHVGAPGGGRAVGNALAGNPFPLIVPCHRVISSNRHIGGYGGGIEMKQALLAREGVIFDDSGRVTCARMHYEM